MMGVLICVISVDAMRMVRFWIYLSQIDFPVDLEVTFKRKGAMAPGVLD